MGCRGTHCAKAGAAASSNGLASRLLRNMTIALPFKLLSNLGERLGEGVMQEMAFVLPPHLASPPRGRGT
jgi:hypothetical protein